MIQFRSPLLTSSAAIILSLAATSVSAKFEINEKKTASKSGELKTSYSPRSTAYPKELRSQSAEFPTLDGGTEILEFSAPYPDMVPEGCLVAMPSSDATWRLVVDPSDAQSHFDAVPAFSGSVPLLQITTDGAWRKSATISVEFSKSSSSPSADERAKRLLGGTVLNPEGLVHSENSAKGRRSVASPPGDFRVRYSSEDGDFLRIEFSDLGISSAELSSLRVVHQGTAVPILASDATGFVVYAPYVFASHDGDETLFVELASTSPSPSASSSSSFSTLTGADSEVSVARTKEYIGRNHYERFTTLPLGDRFFFHRVRFPGNPQSGTFDLDFPDALTSLDINVETDLYGFNENTSFNPDHYADIRLEDVDLTRIAWEGFRSEFTSNETITLNSQPTSGTVTLLHQVPNDSPPVAAGADIQLLRAVTLGWEGYPRVDESSFGWLDLEAAGSERRVSLGGFPLGTVASDILLANVTDEYAPTLVSLQPDDLLINGDGTVSVEFEAPASASNYVIRLLNQIPEPALVEESFDLPTVPAHISGFIVAPDDFHTSLQVLVDFRGASETVMFDPRAAYDAYSHGRVSPDSINEAVSAMLDSAATKDSIPWLLLGGHASLDPRDHLGLITTPQVPTYIEESVVTTIGTMENSIDFPYALINEGDLLPDLLVGRIPARSTEDMRVAVERLLAHEAAADSLIDEDRLGIFVSDSDSEFLADQPVWTGNWDTSGNTSLRLDRPDFANTRLVHDEIKAGMETGTAGAGLVMYIGHGFNNQWANANMMSSDKVDEIDTEGRWPIVMTYTCLNGYYAFPGNSILTLGEAWMFNVGDGTLRGASANIAPVSIDFYLEQSTYAKQVMSAVAEDPEFRPQTAGELIFTAQTAFATSFPSLETTLQEYILFGDPNTPLAIGPAPPAGMQDWLDLD